MEQRKRNPQLGLRRLVPVLVAAVMMVPTVAVGVEASAEEPGKAVVASGAPVHRKYVKDNGDGTYDLTLSVTGDSPDSVGKKRRPVDVVLVLDRSSSMLERVDKNKTRWDMAKEAATSLTQRLLTSENAKRDPSEQARMALVTFDTWALTALLGTSQWTTSAQSLTGFISADSRKPKPGKGSNWESAFQRANELLNGTGSRRNVDQYIVFLTSSAPTMRVSAMEYRGKPPDNAPDVDRVWTGENTENRPVYGGGNCDVGLRCYRAAANEAKKRGATKLFAVGAGGKEANEAVKKLAEEAKGDFYDAGTPEKLYQAIDEILVRLLGITRQYWRVSLNDELSEYVTPVEDKDGDEFSPRLEFGAFDASNGSVKETDPAGANMEARYDRERRTLTLGFKDDSKLTPGATYWATLTIKPTRKAQEDYVKRGGMYSDVGDPNTDADGRSTSSGKRGLRSNAEGKASLTYEMITWTNGNREPAEGQTVPLPQPVIQLKPTTLTLVARVDNTHAGNHGASPSDWSLSALNRDNAGVHPTVPAKSMALAPGESGTDKMATKPTLVVPGTYKLRQEANPSSQYPYFPGYAVGKWFCVDNKGSKLNSTNPSVRDEIVVGAGQNVTCLVTYTAKPGGVSWSKVDEHGGLLGGSNWSLAGADGRPGLVADNGGHDTDKTPGGFAVTGLKWGGYRLGETKAPDGHQLLPTPLTVSVFPVSDAVQEPSSFMVKAGDDGKIVNRKLSEGAAVKTAQQSAKSAGLAKTGARIAAVVAVVLFGAVLAGGVQLARRGFMR
ncbi:DUF7604 domain-containing protein [Bifidobacterium panos]|uniref:Prespore-cell-inducing factor n=1 Tax=Bifidobacterium panos TaxID=2675321 RepID=A0ABX1SY12_9BIFI|nr:VWA domain-containing protein [Bifidobacterium sp. DSM 109963]NMN02169.1 prespore-cell-inducing factor [Bifidobacterium sp. DSM 109963]